ncbi:MAG: helix-turn-helix domain-containing protein [Rhodomicrobium sp.]
MQGPTARPILPGYNWANASSVRYHERQQIFLEGERSRWVYRIEEGAVCLYKTLHTHKRRVFDFGFEGEVIGLSASNEYTLSAQAAGTAILSRAAVAELYDLAANDSRFALELYRAVSSELETARRLVTLLSQNSLLERVAQFLLGLTYRNAAKDDPQLLTLPMTRPDVASLLGMSPETLSKLADQALIEPRGRSQIFILDVFELQRLEQ